MVNHSYQLPLDTPTPTLSQSSNAGTPALMSPSTEGLFQPGPSPSPIMRQFNEKSYQETPLKSGGRVEEAGGGYDYKNFLKKRKKTWIIVGGIITVIVICAIAIPIAVTSHHSSSHKSSSSSTSPTGSSSSAPSSQTGSTSGSNPSVKSGAWYGTGADGSEMITEDGSTFVYQNKFGGTWNAIPFNDSARAQSDVPALNEKWEYGVDRIHGVNLGGWLVIEPFITVGLFEPFQVPGQTATVVDEWTLCEALGSSMAETIEKHYATFITEKDFADIAAAGLNWVRIPVAWWMIETWEGEPFLEGVAWKYFLKGIEWARKYGLRINLDFHAVPGSQNGYNHSGKLGTINFLMGTMGIANAQRALNYIRTLAEFISQPQYSNVIPMFSVLNEALLLNIGEQQMKEFYLQVYQMVREISGVGEGNGPFMVIHDGFTTETIWYGFLEGADRLGLDTHPYLCFDYQTVNANNSLALSAAEPCQWWGSLFNTTFNNFGFEIAGEWSLAVNDCGQYINNVGTGTRYEGNLSTSPLSRRQGSCDGWDDYQNWGDDIKNGLINIARGHMDALGNWFFWTWKTGNSTVTNAPANPFWSYSLALQYGYMETDPRTALGFCESYMGSQGFTYTSVPFTSFSAWQTGGPGAGTIQPSATQNFAVWPPASLTGYPTASLLPTYTPTGKVITLSVSSPTAVPSGDTNTNPGDGWFQTSDTGGWYTSNPHCNYVNPWSGNGQPAPTTNQCSSAAAKMRLGKRAPMPEPTPPPFYS